MGGDAGEEGGLRAQPLAGMAESNGRREADELLDEQRNDQAVRIEAQCHAVVDRHAGDGVDAVDVAPVGEQEQPYAAMAAQLPRSCSELAQAGRDRRATARAIASA